MRLLRPGGAGATAGATSTTCSTCDRELVRGCCPSPSCPGPRDVEVSAGRRRDGRFELATLELAAAVVPVPVAGGSPFVTQATARLKLGERVYGDRWMRQGVSVLLSELLEEAADLGAWAVLVLQSLDELDPDQREVVEACVLDAARAGARAHSAVMRALGAIPPVGQRLADDDFAGSGEGRGPGGHGTLSSPGNAHPSRTTGSMGRASVPSGRLDGTR